MIYEFNFAALLDYLPTLARGFLITLQLSCLAVIVGAVLGFGLAVARTSGSRLLRAGAGAVVEVVRGVPVLIQLFWMFFCLPLLLGVEVGAFLSAFLTLTLYMAALASESFRAAFKTIDRDQRDACVALGLTRTVTIVYVVLPQALLRAAPNLLSNTITVFKESAIVSAVGMADLMFVGRNISSVTGQPIEVLTVVAATYFLFAFPLTLAVSAIEARVLRRMDAA